MMWILTEALQLSDFYAIPLLESGWCKVLYASL